MKIELEPGKYVLAVSGGVDSVVLLDLVCKKFKDHKADLIVAHFDHGIRKNSVDDRKFVNQLAAQYGLKFFYEEGRLGAAASEALARQKRYVFLRQTMNQTKSDAIITAHHQDDLLETIIINILRGTGRKGLSSLSAKRADLRRPLLNFPKERLLKHARDNNLNWREDETNLDDKYLRNYIRHNLIRRLSDKQKQALLEISRQSYSTNLEIDRLIENLFLKGDGISQELFAGLAHNVSSEMVAVWLRQEKVRLDKKTIGRLVVSMKTTAENKIIQINNAKYFILQDGIIRMKNS